MADDDDNNITTTTRGRRKVLLDPNVIIGQIADEPNLLLIPADRHGIELTNVPLRHPWRTTPPRSSRDWVKADQLDPRPRTLKQWLRANCLTQAMFADKVGCSQGFVSLLLKGKLPDEKGRVGRAARAKSAARIEKLTGLSHDQFLDLGVKNKKRGPPGGKRSDT